MKSRCCLEWWNSYQRVVATSQSLFCVDMGADGTQQLKHVIETDRYEYVAPVVAAARQPGGAPDDDFGDDPELERSLAEAARVWLSHRFFFLWRSP